MNDQKGSWANASLGDAFSLKVQSWQKNGVKTPFNNLLANYTGEEWVSIIFKFFFKPVCLSILTFGWLEMMAKWPACSRLAHFQTLTSSGYRHPAGAGDVLMTTDRMCLTEGRPAMSKRPREHPGPWTVQETTKAFRILDARSNLLAEVPFATGLGLGLSREAARQMANRMVAAGETLTLQGGTSTDEHPS